MTVFNILYYVFNLTFLSYMVDQLLTDFVYN